MILKTPDEQASRDLIVLESLMKETDDRHVRDKINVEMKKIRAGLRGEQQVAFFLNQAYGKDCLLYTSPSPRDATLSRMPSSA